MKKQTKLTRSCCEGISFISDIKTSLPNDEILIKVSDVFKALSDPSRAKILYALLDYEICVGEMVRVLGLPQSHVSHQLRTLRKYGIVDFTKDKKMSFYFIKDDYIRDMLRDLLKVKKLEVCEV